jgi:hypothetical protein
MNSDIARAPDGATLHVRFDDTHGHVMEQTGHKLGDVAPPSPTPAAPTTAPIE